MIYVTHIVAYDIFQSYIEIVFIFRMLEVEIKAVLVPIAFRIGKGLMC